MLNPHPHTAPAPIRHHFVVDPNSSRPPYIPHHLLGSKAHHRVMHWIDPLKRSAIPKHHIRGVFALGRRPVVLSLNGSADLLVQWMTLPHQLAQHSRPVRRLLLLHQLLGTPDITDPRKTALLSPVGYPCFVHLPTQPFPPVHTHLDQKGKPRLKPKMQKSQLFMHPVI